jgi:hypothetical protein
MLLEIFEQHSKLMLLLKQFGPAPEQRRSIAPDLASRQQFLFDVPEGR